MLRPVEKAPVHLNRAGRELTEHHPGPFLLLTSELHAAETLVGWLTVSHFLRPLHATKPPIWIALEVAKSAMAHIGVDCHVDNNSSACGL